MWNVLEEPGKVAALEPVGRNTGQVAEYRDHGQVARATVREDAAGTLVLPFFHQDLPRRRGTQRQDVAALGADADRVGQRVVALDDNGHARRQAAAVDELEARRFLAAHAGDAV